MVSSEYYIFAGGGTGGHLYPGLAVAEQLLRIRPQAVVVFACSSRAIDRRILDPLPYVVVPQPMLPFSRTPGGMWAFIKAWRRSKAQAREMLGDLKPAAVLGLGGFAAVAVAGAAAGANIPAGLLNPDAVAGKANRYLARGADVIFTQFESTAEHLPRRLRSKVRAVGCPVRADFAAADRDDAMRYFGLKPNLKTLLINGGSQGAASINDAVGALAGADAMADLSQQWQVLHVTGPAKSPRVHQTDLERIDVMRLEYCDRMDLAYAAADLAICRGGASTVAELAASATPAVIMPYPWHRDRQQYLNARALVDAGAAVICEDVKQPALNVSALRAAIGPILSDASLLGEMSAAAGGSAKPHAASEVANWLAGQGR